MERKCERCSGDVCLNHPPCIVPQQRHRTGSPLPPLPPRQVSQINIWDYHYRRAREAGKGFLSRRIWCPTGLALFPLFLHVLIVTQLLLNTQVLGERWITLASRLGPSADYLVLEHVENSVISYSFDKSWDRPIGLVVFSFSHAVFFCDKLTKDRILQFPVLVKNSVKCYTYCIRGLILWFFLCQTA